LDLREGVKGAELVILAAPVLKITELAKKIRPFLKKGAILIDAGSTKDYIVREIEKVSRKEIDFIGCHPIAGSEKAGIARADKNLFKGCWCIVTRTARTDRKALEKVRRFWRALDMKIVVMGPIQHDRLLSKISHLPHAVAVALVNTLGKKDSIFAAGGFKDTTRIASGEPELWKDIFVTNRDNVLKDIRTFKRELSKTEKAIGYKNTTALLQLLQQAKKRRDLLEVKSVKHKA
jgi:prephenate dehydrogenase